MRRDTSWWPRSATSGSSAISTTRRSSSCTGSRRRESAPCRRSTNRRRTTWAGTSAAWQAPASSTTSISTSCRAGRATRTSCRFWPTSRCCPSTCSRAGASSRRPGPPPEKQAVRRLSLTTAGVSSEPTVRDGVLTRPLLLKLLLAGALSFAVVNLVPRTVSGGGSVPPVRMLIETATIVGVICATLMFWGLRSDLGLPATAAVYAVVFNVLVIVVKLGLAPRGFYEVNQVRNLDGTFSIDNAFGAVLAAGVVFALFPGGYLGLVRSLPARVEHTAGSQPLPPFPPRPRAGLGLVGPANPPRPGGGAPPVL